MREGAAPDLLLWRLDVVQSAAQVKPACQCALCRYWASPTILIGSWPALCVSACTMKPPPQYSSYCSACTMKLPLPPPPPYSNYYSAWPSSSCPALCMWASWRCWMSPSRHLQYASMHSVHSPSACIRAGHANPACSCCNSL